MGTLTATNTTIVVLRRSTAADRYRDLQPAGTVTRTTVACIVAPRSSNELSEPGRQGVMVGLSVFAPAGTDVAATDQIEYDGDVYDIDGDIAAWASPFSDFAAVEFALRRAVG